ncbi:hypothetical protein HDV57DRAFT_483611 [Trichoderma longibrachiatum]
MNMTLRLRVLSQVFLFLRICLGDDTDHTEIVRVVIPDGSGRFRVFDASNVHVERCSTSPNCHRYLQLQLRIRSESRVQT